MATDEYTPSKRATFLYFAYGSNLWTKRIHHRNPTAVRKGIAELKVSIISIQIIKCFRNAEITNYIFSFRAIA